MGREIMHALMVHDIDKRDHAIMHACQMDGWEESLTQGSVG
jgi:hypothetical protein